MNMTMILLTASMQGSMIAQADLSCPKLDLPVKQIEMSLYEKTVEEHGQFDFADWQVAWDKGIVKAEQKFNQNPMTCEQYQDKMGNMISSLKSKGLVK